VFTALQVVRLDKLRRQTPLTMSQPGSLEDLPDEEFPSMANVVQAMHGALEQEGLSGESKERAA
jgi:hypothetical protein